MNSISASQCLRVLLLAGLSALAPAASVFAQSRSREGIEFFEKNIRPLLAKRCYACHSKDAKELQGGLLLDTRAGWQKGGDSGPVIVPGKPDASPLIDAVRYGKREMPPDTKLPAAEIALLEQWVKMGAPDPRTGEAVATKSSKIDVAQGRKYWAFQPLRRVEPPTPKNPAWCKSSVDRFVLAKLDAAGLNPSAAADRRTLARRAYFDLIGLPPAPEEIDQFVSDPASDDAAFARLIDRLLDSPHFGERWARHWLDVARFAESHGFEQDYDRPHAYHYRDFVIQAFNMDMPYDQFVRWQLAGDELAPDDPLAMMATGFLGAGVFPTQITANEVEKSRYDALDDMAATTGTAFLGLTIGCARCHDHKYDPIPTHDYYRLVSTFTTTVRSDIDLDLTPQVTKAAQAKFEKEHAPLVEALGKYEREELPGRLAQWAKTDRKKEKEEPAWVMVDITDSASAGGANFLKLQDGSLLTSGANAQFDTYTLVAETSVQNITALRLEALAHSSLPKGGPGRAANGNFALSNVRVSIQPLTADGGRRGGGKPTEVKLVRAKSTFDQQGLPVTSAIDADKKSSWAVDPQFGKDHAAVFELEKPIGFASGTLLTVTLEFQNNAGHNIGRPRLSVTTAPSPVGLEGNSKPPQVAQALKTLDAAGGDIAKVSPEQRQVLLKWYGPRDPRWRTLNQQVQDHLQKAPKPNLVKVMVASEGFTPIRHHTQGADFFDKMYFLKRGDPNQKGEVASQGFLQVLMTAPEMEKHWQSPPPQGWRTSYRRRALANWITDTDYGAGHLLARVIVNRLWQHHLGRGIVATPSDYGLQGERPTHPELLDWLASELIRGGWKLKALHKLIMTSAVYRQSGAADEAKARIDPENRLCWRFNPRRLEAEAIRDSLLAVSGTLDRTMYGPGTLEPGMTRRSIYFMVKRSKLIGMMQLFDAPEPTVSIGRRPSTTIAPQALLFLNNPQVRTWSRNFARRLAPAAEHSLAEAVARAYRLTLGRPPSEDEIAQADAFLSRQVAAYNEQKQMAPRELALADFCQVLMSLNEFVYVE
jgi:hypothetical protein